MLTNIRTQAQVVVGLVVVAVLCQLVAGATRHKHGLAGAVSWVTFIGFWVAVVAAVATLALLIATAVRAAKARA